MDNETLPAMYVVKNSIIATAMLKHNPDLYVLWPGCSTIGRKVSAVFLFTPIPFGSHQYMWYFESVTTRLMPGGQVIHAYG